MSKQFLTRISGILGNLLEHYDQALFALIAPFLSPLFFEGKDPIAALILTYSMLPLGLITRPLGSLFFGWIGDNFGRRQSLFISLLGMALITVAIGCLPTYHSIGYWAPLLLALGRMMQSFFVAGEATGGAIFVLEHTSSHQRSWMSSLYDASAVVGILIASFLVFILSLTGNIQMQWRYLFFLGGITGLIGVFLRLKTEEPKDFVLSKRVKESFFHILKEHKAALFSITAASGFSYVTYSLAFTLMNGYVPVVTSLSNHSMIEINTPLLFFDFLLLPLFGYIAHQWGKEKVMLIGSIGAALFAIPLFSLLNQGGLLTVIFIRSTVIVFGVAFAATYHAWAIEQVPPQHRFRILSLGSALGSQILGAPCTAICLWVYHKTHWTASPGIYLAAAALMASFALRRSMKPALLETQQ